MKTFRTWMFLGAMVVGLVHGDARILAQPAGQPAGGGEDPIVTDEPDKPWNVGVSIEDRTAAKELFLEGNRLYRIPVYAKAAEKYTAALSKWKHPAFYFNLALAQLSQDKDVEARESLERALAHGEEGLPAEELREARKQLQEVKRRIGQILVTCQTQGAEVSLDGVLLFTGPGSYQGWVKAKAHEITAKKVGYLSEARRVTVTPEGLQNIDLRLVTLSQATDASRRWPAWKPWAVVAVGGTIAVVGGALHALSARNFNSYDKEFLGLPCIIEQNQEAPGCAREQIPPSLDHRLVRARQQQVMAVGSYIAGSAVIVVGVVLLYLNRPRVLGQEIMAPLAQNMTVEPAFSGDMFGMILTLDY